MRRILIPALASGLLLVLAAPFAQASTRDLTDVAGDVMTGTINANGDVVSYNREGGAEADILFARIQHTATQVVVYTRYRQLSVPKQYGEFLYEFQGNNGHSAVVDIFTRHGDPQGYADIEWTGPRCTAGWHINYAGDSVSVRIPRACLHTPKYARLTHVSVEQTVRPNGSGKIYYDSPTRDGGTVNQVLNSITPWVVTG